MSRFTEKVIEKIKQEGIEPEAGWTFTTKRSLLWVGIVLAGGLTALAVSMTMFSLLAIDRSPFTIAPSRLFTVAFFRSLPFFWIGLTGVFFTLAILEFRNTRHGYRHRIAPVALISGIVIMAGAFLIATFGADEYAEKMMQDRFPRYTEMAAAREQLWSRPEDGFLSGTITEIRSDGFSLFDREGTDWKIILEERAIVRPLVRLEKGIAVKVIGEKKGDRIFEAEDIRPWERPQNRAPKGRSENPEKRNENIHDRTRSNE